jgi:hypothetical protein
MCVWLPTATCLIVAPVALHPICWSPYPPSLLPSFLSHPHFPCPYLVFPARVRYVIDGCIGSANQNILGVLLHRVVSALEAIPDSVRHRHSEAPGLECWSCWMLSMLNLQTG